MQVHCDEGVANHIGPEPCGVREGVGEASVGERIGQPLSHESYFVPAPTPFTDGRQHGRVRHRERWSTRRGRRPWHVWTLLVREPGDLGSGQRREADGPHREGEEPKPMMHDPEKSDPAIVATKPANKAGRPAAEPVERRAGTEGNADQQSTPGRRAGKACHRRWTAYDKLQGKGRRKGSPHFSTMSPSTCFGRRSTRSSAVPHQAWTA